ncbi:hypothetical protein NDU88_003967 [Pleurodeles waltl]|uniref:Uncharacterized protein n=1 Tax=Pleurodeles waltl TaxID=8319 RepID=A0AAV7KYI5_PLEWA|nr:hypothetical protein NDU88_003967 [Pleurodeles waltl]
MRPGLKSSKEVPRIVGPRSISYGVGYVIAGLEEPGSCSSTPMRLCLQSSKAASQAVDPKTALNGAGSGIALWRSLGHIVRPPMRPGLQSSKEAKSIKEQDEVEIAWEIHSN